MSSLRKRMAEHGFESNDHYEHQLRCLMNYRTSGVRCLNIEGASNRRKTAFASALARAMEYTNVLYYDFTQMANPSVKAEVIDRPDEEGEAQSPLGPFDRAVSEACAYSEAERTILIIDQLQAADFRDHIRIFQFVESTEWTYPLGSLRANPKNLLVFLISEEPLYHSLQKVSFRVWTDPGNAHQNYRPEDFDLKADAQPIFDALSELFTALGITPTQSEFERILHDVLSHARTVDSVRHSIYGWTEGVDHAVLHAREIDPYVTAVIDTTQDYLGMDEIEVGS
jgi:hypothetical protein